MWQEYKDRIVLFIEDVQRIVMHVIANMKIRRNKQQVRYMYELIEEFLTCLQPVRKEETLSFILGLACIPSELDDLTDLGYYIYYFDKLYGGISVKEYEKSIQSLRYMRIGMLIGLKTISIKINKDPLRIQDENTKLIVGRLDELISKSERQLTNKEKEYDSIINRIMQMLDESSCVSREYGNDNQQMIREPEEKANAPRSAEGCESQGEGTQDGDQAEGKRGTVDEAKVPGSAEGCESQGKRTQDGDQAEGKRETVDEMKVPESAEGCESQGTITG